MNEFNRAKRIFISAGEASGDFHASNLVRGIKTIMPDAKFYGMGGKLMCQAGVEIIVCNQRVRYRLCNASERRVLVGSVNYGPIQSSTL